MKKLPLAWISLDFQPKKNLTVETVQAYVSRFRKKEHEPVTVFSDGARTGLFISNPLFQTAEAQQSYAALVIGHSEQ